MLDPQPLVVPPPQPLVVPALWKVEKMHTEDPERGKFHREDWMQHQPAGNYYCRFSWDNPPYPGMCTIFRKGDQPGHCFLVQMFDQSMRPRKLHRDGHTGWEDCGSVLLAFKQSNEEDEPAVYSSATQEQIEFYENVKRAFREATRLDADREREPWYWPCEHVDGYEAAHLATSFYDKYAVDIEVHEDMEFNDEETPVFYSCRGDNRTRHIFDMEERDYIAASPTALDYAKDPLHADFYTRFQAAEVTADDDDDDSDDFNDDDLYRLATIPEKAWLLRCRAAGKMVE